MVIIVLREYRRESGDYHTVSPRSLVQFSNDTFTIKKWKASLDIQLPKPTNKQEIDSEQRRIDKKVDPTAI